MGDGRSRCSAWAKFRENRKVCERSMEAIDKVKTRSKKAKMVEQPKKPRYWEAKRQRAYDDETKNKTHTHTLRQTDTQNELRR